VTSEASDRASPPAPTAAILLIGDELLTGKIRDENGHFLARSLRRRGIRLVELAVVGDDEAVIGAALLRLADRASTVFTSGGVGPTHDDVTLAAIARATGRPLERNVEMESELRKHYGERISEAALAMADLPRGTALLARQGWPVLRLDLEPPCSTRVYILPGVPSLLRAKVEHLEAIPGELPQGDGWHLALLHTNLDESNLAPHLDAIVAAFPGVDIGSYPRWSRGPDGAIHYHVRVTFEAPREHASRAEAARDQLTRVLPPERLVDPEEPV
jgi:molybdenum cofactor synthesis domain-containing protein